MNILRKSFGQLSLISTCMRTQVTNIKHASTLVRPFVTQKIIKPPASSAPWTTIQIQAIAPQATMQAPGLIRTMASLAQMHRTGPHIKKRKSRNPLNGSPFAKGVVLKTVIKKPKKPNSANRKCVIVRLSNGKEMVAYVPGIGHNLQEHNIVLVRVGRLKDCPGVKLKCVRGKYDLSHVIKQKA